MKNLLNKKTYTTQSYENKYEIVKELISDFQELDINYSKHFMNNAYYARTNYKTDIRKLEKYLITHGDYDLSKFMSDYKSKIFNDDFFISNSGFMDALLYSFDKEHPLSGSVLSDYGEDEFIIKYFYDYDKYDLGKKYLLQYYNKIKDFYHDCAKNYLDEYRNNTETLYFVDNFNNIKEKFSLITEVKKGYLCIININKYFEFLSDEFSTPKKLKDYLEERFNNEKHREERFNYIFVESKIVVAFGKDIILDNIGLDVDKYDEIIDVNYSVKKYNI